MLAATRPNDIDLALFVHVLGATILFGGLVTAASAGLIGWRDESPRLRRLAAMTMLAGALPGWIVMRIGAEWTYSKEHLDSLTDDPTWLGIGFTTADIGGLLLLIALVVGGIGYARGRDGLLRASIVIAALLVVVYAVAVWAMGAKPS